MDPDSKYSRYSLSLVAKEKSPSRKTLLNLNDSKRTAYMNMDTKMKTDMNRFFINVGKGRSTSSHAGTRKAEEEVKKNEDLEDVF